MTLRVSDSFELALFGLDGLAATADEVAEFKGVLTSVIRNLAVANLGPRTLPNLDSEEISAAEVDLVQQVSQAASDLERAAIELVGVTASGAIEAGEALARNAANATVLENNLAEATDDLRIMDGVAQAVANRGRAGKFPVILVVGAALLIGFVIFGGVVSRETDVQVV